MRVSFLSSFLAANASLLSKFYLVLPTAAFTLTSISSSRLPSIAPLQAKNPFHGSNHEDEIDIDQVRQRLEALLVGASTSSESLSRQESPSSKVKSMLKEKPSVREEDPIDFELDLSAQPFLTSIERERKLVEIELLSRLEFGDEGLSDLWTFWFQERGPAAAARLLRAEELVGQGPRKWDEAERELKDLIHEYGVYWAEPVNRLATLYYMQGKLRQSEVLTKIVLKVKPWHFGALSGIVMVYAGLKDAESARLWAARRMPSFAPEGLNRRRNTWVERSVGEAKAALYEAEERLKRSFGKPERRGEVFQGIATDDEWQ